MHHPDHLADLARQQQDEARDRADQWRQARAATTSPPNGDAPEEDQDGTDG